MSENEILEEYKQTYGEELPEGKLQELLEKYGDLETVRKRLGLGLEGRYVRLSDIRREDKGLLIRVKVLKKLTEKEVKGRKLKVYLVGDESGYGVLSNRTEAELEEGKVYAIGPIKVTTFVYFSLMYLPELTMYQNARALEVDYPEIELPEVEERDISELQGRPIIRKVEGVVKRTFGTLTFLLATEHGNLLVRLDRVFKNFRIREGDKIRIYGLALLPLEVSPAARIEIIGEERKELVGIVAYREIRESRRGETYTFYVIYDPKSGSASLLYEFSENYTLEPGDLVAVEVSELREGSYKYLDSSLLSRGVPDRIVGKVRLVDTISLPQNKELCVFELEDGTKLLLVRDKGECSKIESVDVRAKVVEEVAVEVPEVCYEAAVVEANLAEHKLVVHMDGELKELYIEDLRIIKGNIEEGQHVRICFENGEIKLIEPLRE